ncbi:nuclear transport factor 2 family protein [Bacteroidota bacterium]
MKNITYSILTLVFFAGIISCQKKIDIEKEKAAIKAVIEEETNAYIDRDYDRFAATYLQDKSFIRLDARKADYDYILGWGYDYIVGWEEMGSVFTGGFDDNSDTLHYKFVNTNYKIKVYPESAWAVYDETWYDLEEEFVRLNISVRFLEKVNGEWKIVYLSGVNTTSYD